MNLQQEKQKQGFTIIEVVLVLAIAALIFLMVFIALPALQRNQRDTSRKTIIGKVAAAVSSYQSNNRGANLPITANTAAAAATTDFQAKFAGYVDFTTRYKDGSTVAAAAAGVPNGIGIDNDNYHIVIRQVANPLAAGTPTTAYNFDNSARIGATGGTQTSSQIIEIVNRAKCNANGTDIIAGTPRDAAVLIGLENGNSSLCQSV